MSNGYNGTIATEAVQIVNHGSKSTRWNMVILGDGYQESEIPKYHADVDTHLAALKAKIPFGELWRYINVFRVDVTSTDSFLDARIDNPKLTYYNSVFSEPDASGRSFSTDNDRANKDGKRLVPEAHLVLLMINFDAWTIGYSRYGSYVVTCTHRTSITTHEVGHIFGLADEYVVAGTGHASGAEPTEPNVTFNSNRDTIKWADLVLPSTPVPSSCRPESTVCDAPADPITVPDVVGAFEGARYFEYGSYRPTLQCCMGWGEYPFCPVCERVIREVLAPFQPVPTVVTADFVIDSPNVHTNYKKVIHLKGDFGLAILYFVPEEEALGTNRKRQNRNVYDIYYSMNTWSQFVDLLRNEKPVYFYYDVSNNTAVLKTSDEPIGEEES